MPGLLGTDTSDLTNQPLNVRTLKSVICKGLKVCLSIRMQQQVLQVTHAKTIQEAKNRCLNHALGLSSGCVEDCTNCNGKNLLKQFTDLMSKANDATRPEPFGMIAAQKLEKVLLAYQENAWLLLGDDGFSNGMFKCLVEVMKIGLRNHLMERGYFAYGALSRLEEIYRVVTTGIA